MTDRKSTFAALHVPGKPLVLFNVWDAGCAAAVAKAGAKAIATGSASVAGANGFTDGETVPLDLVIANAERIVRATDLPVSVDFESGYGGVAAEVGVSAGRLAAAGAVGINLEDADPAHKGVEAIFSITDAAQRIAAAASAGLFVNARTDLFIRSDPASHDDAMVDAALERARAFANAGAGCLFVPLLSDEGLLARLCEASPLPVNAMMFPGLPDAKRLAELGVARISHGPFPWRGAMAWVESTAREALST